MSDRYSRWSHEGAPSGEEAARIQAGIDRTLRETVAHRPYSPGEMPSSGRVTVVGAPTVVGGAERGWVDSRPLTTPLTGHAERVVGAMIDQAFPPSSSPDTWKSRSAAKTGLERKGLHTNRISSRAFLSTFAGVSFYYTILLACCQQFLQ
jgi:hypothetical protein